VALACDIRLCSNNASFGLPEVRIGSIAAVGGIQQLMRSVPHSAAMTMLLTGGRIDAEKAARFGIVSEVMPLEDLMPRALELAREIAANAPLAVQAARLLALQGAHMTLQQAMLLEQLAWASYATLKIGSRAERLSRKNANRSSRGADPMTNPKSDAPQTLA
jgi:E-phenylitaconyl-CoA hydratase